MLNNITEQLSEHDKVSWRNWHIQISKVRLSKFDEAHVSWRKYSAASLQMELCHESFARTSASMRKIHMCCTAFAECPMQCTQGEKAQQPSLNVATLLRPVLQGVPDYHPGIMAKLDSKVPPHPEAALF